MIIPVRCFSCGFPVGAFYKEFEEKAEGRKRARTVLNDMKIRRYCCRRMLVSQVDVVDEVAPFKK